MFSGFDWSLVSDWGKIAAGTISDWKGKYRIQPYYDPNMVDPSGGQYRAPNMAYQKCSFLETEDRTYGGCKTNTPLLFGLIIGGAILVMSMSKK